MGIDDQAAKIFERMRADVQARLTNVVPPGREAHANEIALVTLQAVAREIAEHRILTGAT